MENLSELRIFSGFMTDSGFCHLIKNSPKLKTIELNDKHINETTIDNDERARCSRLYSAKSKCSSTSTYRALSHNFPDMKYLYKSVYNLNCNSIRM